MKKFKGTQGTWQFKQEGNGYSVFLKEEGAIGSCYIAREIEQGKDEGRADAKAISAVPEMINTLQEVDYTFKNLSVADMVNIPESLMVMLAKVRKTLKKAI